jgi:beta-glucanase (GH16 family)
MQKRWFTLVPCAALLLSCGDKGQGGSSSGGDTSSTESGTSGTPTTGGSTGSSMASACTAKGADKPGWSLVWCDEFDGPAIDETKWTFDIGDGGDKASGPGWGNQEKEYYTRRTDNAQTKDGNLVISALKDGPHYANGGAAYDYSSARMVTRGKADWTFGRIEARAKVPKGQGLWPAIWMLPSENAYGGWAASGEIDIMELKGQAPDAVYGTLHFGEQWPKNQFVGCTLKLASGSFADDFHVFAAEWDASGIRMFVDDIGYETQAPKGAAPPASVCVAADGKTPVTPNINKNVTDAKAGYWSASGSSPAPFNRAFHILLNVAVGGEFVGDTIDPAVFPQKMVVDYVRVYQKSK